MAVHFYSPFSYILCSAKNYKIVSALTADLPRNGELLLTLFDQQQGVQGAMMLVFDQGAVIDATTGEDGVGHITVRTDTDKVALLFSIEENGELTCSLWLKQAEASGDDTERD